MTAANGRNVENNWPILCDVFGQWAQRYPGLDEPLSLIGLIGTIAKESGTFAPVEEAYWLSEAARWAYYSDTSKHAPYAGGPQFHGIGFIQTTHVSGYQAVQDRLASDLGISVELVGNPQLLLDPTWAAHAAAIFWINKGMVDFCRAENWAEVRRRVWGAYGDADGVGKLQFADNRLLPLARARELV